MTNVTVDGTPYRPIDKGEAQALADYLKTGGRNPNYGRRVRLEPVAARLGRRDPSEKNMTPNAYVDLTITRIEVDPGTGDVTFFFDEDDLEAPWSVREFIPGSPTRLWLEAIELLVKQGKEN